MSRKKLSSYLASQWFSIIIATIFSFILGLAASLIAVLIGPALQVLMMPDKSKAISFSALFGPRLSPLATWSTGLTEITAENLILQLPAFLVILAAVKGSLGLCQWYIWERLTEFCAKSIRSDLVLQYLRLNPAARKVEHSGMSEETLSSALSTDVRLYKEYLVRFYGGVPREGLQVLFLAITLFLLSPKLFLIFFAGVAPAIGFVRHLGIKLKKRVGVALKDYSSIVEWLQQRLIGIETIKHYKTENIEVTKMYDLNFNLFKKFFRAARVKARTSPMLELVTIVAMVLVLFFALRQVASGEATGAIQLSFFATLAMFSQAAAKMGKYINVNREGAAAIVRLKASFDFLETHSKEEINIPVKHDSKNAATTLHLENVCVCYPGENIDALTDFSFKFVSSKIYCVCGPSGAGKTTMFNVILGLIAPSGGNVFIHTGEVKGGRLIGYMPQKVKLLPGTVAENISFPNPVPIKKEIKEALAEVGLLDIVDNLEEAVDTFIGEGGKGVSGGQAQRIQLARLAYHKFPIVLVDEGTSALDPEIEQIVFNLLKKIARLGAIVIIIAHRQSVAAIADEILLLNKGMLVEAGACEKVLSSAKFKEVTCW